MSPKKRLLSVAVAGSAPPDLKTLLGPPPLLDGEDAQAYDDLYHRIREAIAPRDVFEEVWARDFVDNLWEMLRLRRIKVKLVRASANEGLERLLRPLTGSVQNHETANGWMRRDKAAVKEVDRRLKQAGLDREAITAHTFALNLGTLERIEGMRVQAEARRTVILREIDRHRSVVAQRLREIASEVEDAEYREIADGEGAP